MWPEERALRGLGAVDEVLLARPERPRRWTLPITALLVIPPSSAAIWLADNPSAHSFFRSSTLSSVQPMALSPSDSRPWMQPNPAVGRPFGGQTHTRQDGPENRSAARVILLSGKDANIPSCPTGRSRNCRRR